MAAGAPQIPNCANLTSRLPLRLWKLVLLEVFLAYRALFACAALCALGTALGELLGGLDLSAGRALVALGAAQVPVVGVFCLGCPPPLRCGELLGRQRPVADRAFLAVGLRSASNAQAPVGRHFPVAREGPLASSAGFAGQTARVVCALSRPPVIFEVRHWLLAFAHGALDGPR